MAQDNDSPALDGLGLTFEARYTCTFCRHEPATHLLVADVVNERMREGTQTAWSLTRGRYVLLVCQTCGIQGIADCEQSGSFKNPMLFKLAKFDVQVYPHD